MNALKLASRGRGRSYTPLRGVIETTLRLAYSGAWPARVLDRVPGIDRVARLEHRLELLPPRDAAGAGAAGAVNGGRGAARPPLRIAFASDLHFGPLTPRRVLARARALLAEAEPDVLLLGGDYVFLEAGQAEAAELERWVAGVPARLKLAVLGNHDLWTHHGLIERALENAGARVLVNASAFLPAPWDDVAVVGLDDPWTGAPDAARAFAGAAGAALSVVLAHAPEVYPFVRGFGARLLLCGHTHGGQVALPSGPVIVHGRLGRRWPCGLYDLPDLRLFVSRGLGNVDLPLRLFATPDVSVFTLV